MRLRLVLTSALVLSSAAVLPAQNARIYSTPSARLLRVGDDQPRAALGITTSGSTSARDTLGLLVSSVSPNSPAEKAGLEEGDRIASINGLNLRIASADVGDFDVSSAMSRRLTRELSRLHPGDDVDLRVYSRGQFRSMHLRTIDSDSLYSRRRSTRSEIDDRPTLGFGIGSTNSRRDTLGVLVMFVDDSGPAARAGLEEGNRIAAIENVDLRVGREDSGDEFIGNAKVRRLQREISQLRPGDDVELRVYSSGQFHTLRLRAVRASDLPHRRGTFIISGDVMGMMPPDFPFGIDGAFIGGEVRGAIERAMEGAGRALEGVGRGLDRVRIRWQDDLDDEPIRIEPVEPIKIEPLEPSRLRSRTPVPAGALYRSALLDDSSAHDPVAAAIARRHDAASDERSDVGVDVAGLRMVPVGTELAAYLGKGSERGLLVIDVPEWARDVIRPGDVLLSIDGHAVRTGDAMDEVTVALPRFRDAQLDILRDSVHHSVTLPARR
jgi:S1-C subfamily serine protease